MLSSGMEVFMKKYLTFFYPKGAEVLIKVFEFACVHYQTYIQGVPTIILAQSAVWISSVLIYGTSKIYFSYFINNTIKRLVGWLVRWLIHFKGSYSSTCYKNALLFIDYFWLHIWKGCSLNIVFSKNSRKFATSPLPANGCYWLYKQLPANRSDCTLALLWELWRSLTAMLAREGMQWIVKKHNFSWTPCMYIWQLQNFCLNV